MDTIKQFQHHRRSSRLSIFKWISRTHMAYYNPNGARIYFIKASQLRIWYFAVRHAAMMLNQVPGRPGLTLTTTFELVHNSKTDSKIWFELFSIGYFNHDTDNSESRSKLQAHTLDGISVGRDDRSNSIVFYNPVTSSYYRPPTF